MSDATPGRPGADRNLLFGILALQMDFIGRDALIAAMNAWVLDKAKSLNPPPRLAGLLNVGTSADGRCRVAIAMQSYPDSQGPGGLT